MRRTASSSGQVTNAGTTPVTGLVDIRTYTYAVQSGGSVLNAKSFAVPFSLSPGASVPLNLSVSDDVPPGGRMESLVVLDILTPVSVPAYASTARTVYNEATTPTPTTGTSYSQYLALIAAATTRDELETTRNGGVVQGVSVAGWEPDYGAGKLTYAQYLDCYNAYIARIYG